MISAFIHFLAAQYRQGDTEGVLRTTRSILDTIPDDLVALQFMGLVYHQLGQREKAGMLFRRAANLYDDILHGPIGTVCESAARISYREATRPESGLGDGWLAIALALKEYGFDCLAERAMLASRQSHQNANESTKTEHSPENSIKQSVFGNSASGLLACPQ